MGLPMAGRLLSAGFGVYGLDILPARQFGEFSARMLDAERAAASADILISVVRDQRQTLNLCFDVQRLFGRARYPRILVICSTLSPRFVRELATRLPDDVELVDAPMSGAPIAATEGELSFMIGGAENTVDALMPMFEAMGNRLFKAGDSGNGMTLKVLNNYVAATSVVAVRRTLAMAEGLGINLDLLRDVMRESSGATWYGDRFEQISWAREGYDPANTIGILEKDVLSALDAISNVDALPCPDLDQAILDSLRTLKPLGDADHG